MKERGTAKNIPDAPLVSVVMPAYNAAAFIEESIRSVIRQTWRALELLVVDDASTDGTVAVVERLARTDPRIRLLTSPRNGGVSAARNRGMAAAAGRYLMFLDSDDLWLESKVARQVTFMQETGCAVSYMDYLRFKNLTPEVAWPVTAPSSVSYDDLLVANEIGMLTGAIDREQVKPLPAFERQGHEDYIFWLDVLKAIAPRTALKTPTPTPFACYRERDGSVSSNHLKAALWHWEILERQNQRLPAKVALMARYSWRALMKRNAMLSRQFAGAKPQA